MIISKITGGATEKLFTAEVLGKHKVDYLRCVETGFIQTSPVHWLDEAYSDAITSLDLGLLWRNEKLVTICSHLIGNSFSPSGRFLDYAGGYGVFTRMMRDHGFDFHHIDPYCENLFAKLFEVTCPPTDTKYELATAFEVFEHFNDPLEEIGNILRYSDSILFSTELVPRDKEMRSPDDWWYFAPETGQHIAFYTRESLDFIAEKFGMHVYSGASRIGLGVHLLSRRKFKRDPLGLFHEKLSLVDYAKAATRMFDLRVVKALLEQCATMPKVPRPSLLGADARLAKETCFVNVEPRTRSYDVKSHKKI